MEFKVGDKIKFEVAANGHRNTPRWTSNRYDNGATGIWAEGVVTQINEYWIVVDYTIESYIGTGKVSWPNKSNMDYDSSQWSLSGYLQLFNPKVNFVCDCGGEKSRTTHSAWCSTRRRE